MLSPTTRSVIGDGPGSSPSSTSGTDDGGKREPDPDAIKMFVGQVSLGLYSLDECSTLAILSFCMSNFYE